MSPLLPISTGQPVIVFSDLDGTYIDHYSYSPEGSAAALKELQNRAWPLVFCSSKTFAEQVFLQQQLGLYAPFILENGSAVAIPKGYFATLAPAPIQRSGYEIFPLAHADFGSARAEIAQFQGIQGFSDVNDAELSAVTGLKGEALSRARERWFTETLVTQLDTEQVRLLGQQFAKNGWVLARGGRFYTLLSAQADKGRAMQWLVKVFAQNLPEMPVLAAIGDSPNDFPLLAAADFPFLVQRQDGSWADLELPGLTKVDGIGPAGFSAAIRMLTGD